MPLHYKLVGVGPIDNRPSTDKLRHFVRKKKLWHKKDCDIWHMICVTWHVTCDMWHVTHDTWHVNCDILGEVNIFSNVSSLALTVCDLRYFDYSEEKADSLTDWLNDWMNNKAFCRTAPATLGLLNIEHHIACFLGFLSYFK